MSPSTNEQANGDNAATYCGAMLIWLLLAVLAPIETDNHKRDHASRETETQREFLRLLLIPSRTNYGLPLLIIINIAVYLLMALSGLGVASFQTEDLVNWGANYGPLDHQLGVLRLITSQFVHGGLMHLLGNIYGLLFAGMFLAPIATNGRLIALYLALRYCSPGS